MSLELTSNDLQNNLKMREVSGGRVYEFEDFTLDADHLLLFREGVQLKLTPKVVETLLALIERPGEVLSKDDLMRVVWPDSIVEESNLSQNLYLLRKTLGTTNSGEPFIETLRRRGYRFSPSVTISSNPFGRTDVHRSVKISRKANIYEVVDWQNHDEPEAPIVELPRPVANRRFSRASVAAMALIGLLVIAAVVTISAALFSSRTGAVPLASFPELSFSHLTNGIDVNDATISPDGFTFVYHEVDGDVSRLWLQQVGQATRVELMPPSKWAFLSKTFAPDGRSVYFVASEKDAAFASVYRIPALGGVPVKVADGANTTIAVSPDGTHIAFTRINNDNSHSAIVVTTSDGGDEHILTESKPGNVIWGGLSWSADGRSIAYGEVDLERPAIQGPCNISAIDPQTGVKRQLSPDGWDSCGRMEWTNDGQGLLFIGTRKGEVLSTARDQLYYLSVADGQARRLTTDGYRHQVSSLGLTREGSVLTVPFNLSSQLWAANSDGDAATARQITNGSADGRAGLAPLPDGGIAYVTRAADKLSVWTVGADGSNARQVTSSPNNVEELRATSDGRRFYFSSLVEGRPRLFTCRPDGSDVRQVPLDDSFNVDSTISPDGRFLVYASAVTRDGSLRQPLRISPADGGHSTELTRSDGFSPHFSPDGNYISYVDQQDGLHVISFPAGEPVADLRAIPAAVLNVGAHWTPDGRALAYIVRSKGVGNIWLQPLDGNEPHQLTNFTSGEIHNFAFSADGKALILARGYPIKDAVLVKITARDQVL